MFSPSDHTFVLCAYGESPYLEECLSSLMAQTTRTNVLMATSTPNDRIRAVASGSGVPLFVNPDGPGIASDWNFAISCATTPLVTVAHQDDTYAPAYAEHALKGMGRARRPLIFFTNYGEIRNGEEVNDNRLLSIKRRLLRPMAKVGNISDSTRTKRRILSLGSSICCPSVTLNLPALPSPPFRTGMKSDLDWDAWERFSRLDGSFVYDPEILMHHRIHEGSETSALIKDNTRTHEDLEMLKRFWPSPVARLINLIYSQGQKSNG